MSPFVALAFLTAGLAELSGVGSVRPEQLDSLHDKSESSAGGEGVVPHSELEARRSLAISLRQGSATDEEVRRHAEGYISAISQRKSIALLHISKNAGTSMCRWALSNGCKAPGGNCWQGIGQFRWFSGWRPDGEPRTCAELTDSVLDRELNFVGNEGTALDEGNCPELWNIIIVRDPIERLLSHIAMLIEWKCCGFEDPWEAASGAVSTKWLFEHKYNLADNYMTRVLLGEDAWNKAFNSLGEEHLQSASKVLRSFDAVYVVGPNLTDLVHTSLGWQNEEKREGVGATDLKEHLKSLISPAEMEVLRKQNRFDLALFEEGKRLAEADAAFFQHPAFRAEMDGSIKCGCGLLCPGTGGLSS